MDDDGRAAPSAGLGRVGLLVLNEQPRCRSIIRGVTKAGLGTLGHHLVASGDAPQSEQRGDHTRSPNCLQRARGPMRL